MAFADESATLPRSYLFVPGSRPERFAKALQSGADAVIIDLEDAVADQDKNSARVALVEWLGEHGNSVYVRINGHDTPWYEHDVEALGLLRGVAGLVVPKAMVAERLEALIAACRPDMAILPIIESAAGFDAICSIANVRGVQRLLFGTIDFQADLGSSLTEEELSAFRPPFVVASRIAGIGSPVDGVTTVLDDADVLRSAAQLSKRYGFGGKLCIHPRQIAPVHAGFVPSDRECDWARRVLAAIEASGGEATTVDGEMVDVPVLFRARSILQSQSKEAVS